MTLSTLDAMFQGKIELFRGLTAEKWVEKQQQHPSPVLRLDISIAETDSIEKLELTLKEIIERTALFSVSWVLLLVFGLT